jgi:hypothetical protein
VSGPIKGVFMNRICLSLSLFVSMCIAWLYCQRANGAPPVANTASVCWHAVLADREMIALIALPQLYDKWSHTVTWSAVYYAAVDLHKDSSGNYPYELFGPFAAGGNPRINRRSRSIQEGPDHGGFFDETNVSYDLKTNGKLVRWQRVDSDGEPKFRRTVLDTTARKWTGSIVVALTNWERALSYNKREYGEFIAADSRPRKDESVAVYDTTTDTWVDDAWFSKITANLKAIHCEHWELTNDRNWLFADFYGAWLRDDKENRQGAPLEARYGNVQFDRRKNVLMFHRGDETPTVLVRFKQALGPDHAFVDKDGEVWLWYEPVYAEGSEGFSNIELVSLHGKTTSALERTNIDFYFLARRNSVYIDSAQSTVMSVRGESRAVQADHDGATLPLTLRIFTWHCLDNQRKDEEISLGNVFEVRGGQIVPKEKPALAVSE